MRTFPTFGLLLTALLLGPGVSAEAFTDVYAVEVSDVTAPVGQHAVMHITLRLRPGYRVLADYGNRVSAFSSLDGNVAFDKPVVRGTAQDDATLAFTVGVTPTAPGRHPINGLFRVGYIQDPDSMSMVSVPLIANVIGTE